MCEQCVKSYRCSCFGVLRDSAVDVEVTSEQLMLRVANLGASSCPVRRAACPRSRGDSLGLDPASGRRPPGRAGRPLAPEEHGGAGAASQGVVPAAIVAEELGRAFHPGPFVPVTVVVMPSPSGPRAATGAAPALVDGTRWPRGPSPTVRAAWDASAVRTIDGGDDRFVVSGESGGWRRRERRPSSGDVPARRRRSRPAPGPGRRARGHGVAALHDGPRPANRRRRAR